MGKRFIKRAELYPYSDGGRFIGKPAREVFNEIEKNNIWLDNESVSGTGSTISQTAKLISELPGIFNSYRIKSILDIPCGDFNWFSHVELNGASYLGADIVGGIIDRNNKKYSAGNISFTVTNLLSDKLPTVDLIFCRDCLVHFSYEDIQKALSNIRHSGSAYLMTTTFTDEEINEDIPTGGWRPINLRKEPFNFPEPEYLLNENCTEMDGQFNDKSLGLWEIKKLIIYTC